MDFSVKEGIFARVKTYVHVAFWFGILILLTIIFAPYYSSFQESFYFVSMLLPVVVGTCYFFNLYLVPQYLLVKKYWYFALYSFYMLIISLYLEMIVIMLSLIFMAQYSYHNMNPVSSDILILAVTLYFIVFLFSFILLIRQVFNKEHALETLKEEKEKYEVGSFSVRSERQMKSVTFDEVVFIESLGDYVKINLESKNAIMTKEKISHLEKRLPDVFVRIHRSFIVNKGQISSYSKEEVIVGSQPLPISRSYRKLAWDKLSQEKLG